MIISFVVILALTATIFFLLGMVVTAIILEITKHSRTENHKSMWHMQDGLTGSFIQEFFDCDNIHTVFLNLNKSKENLYTVKATKEGSILSGERKVGMRWVE
jgi:hypothetical protein